nr:unnamed protein product [Digitaria exilis]
MAAQPLSPLPDELVESIILLRIPPDDPRGLIRAAVTCKHWHRVVSSPSFRRGFRDLHRTPPMLGVLRNYLVRGIPTVMFCPFCISSRGAFVEKENSLYFVLETTPRILFYNLSTLELTVIDSPPMMNDRAWPMRNDRLALMTGEGGGLGCATVDGSNINSQLYLSARNVDPDGH